MAHIALYRKYRSQTFGDLVGQQHVVRTLQNSLKSDRIGHSYLFTGPRGTGKTSTARLLAKALNCETGPSSEPCNTCDHCVAITAGTCFDVFEMDAASESTVDDVREKIIAASEYKPAACRFKIFIIDEVHDLSAKAFDALLKTIEEPPQHIVFILATTEYSKVPPTIRSRCQKYEFHRATLGDLTTRLDHVLKAEGVGADPGAIAAIARLADGGYRDALTLLEQVILSADGHLTAEKVYDQLGLIPDDEVDAVLVAIGDGNVPDLLSKLDALNAAGRDPRSILESLLHRTSDLTRVLFGVDSSGTVDASAHASMHATASKLGKDSLARIRRMIADSQRSVREVSLPRLWLEAELVGLANPQPLPVAPVPAHAPAPAKRAAETTAVVEVAAPKPVAKSAPERTSSDPHEAAWLKTVDTIGLTSKAAALRLQRTRILSATNGVVTIGFERSMDLEWVREKPKFLPLLEDTWAKCRPEGDQKLTLAEDTGSTGPVIEEAIMDVPAEGERLKKLVEDELKDL